LDERAVPDNYRNPHVGRISPEGASEVVSMGIQWMFTEPLDFARGDPEHFDLVWAIMKGRAVQ
jgi:hypothetical protein